MTLERANADVQRSKANRAMSRDYAPFRLQTEPLRRGMSARDWHPVIAVLAFFAGVACAALALL